MTDKPTVYPTGKLENIIEDVTQNAEDYARGRYGLSEEEAKFLVSWLILPDKWRGDEYEDSQLSIMESLRDKELVTFS